MQWLTETEPRKCDLVSLFFYARWKRIYLVLILFLIGFNFAVGRLMSQEGR